MPKDEDLINRMRKYLKIAKTHSGLNYAYFDMPSKRPGTSGGHIPDRMHNSIEFVDARVSALYMVALATDSKQSQSHHGKSSLSMIESHQSSSSVVDNSYLRISACSPSVSQHGNGKATATSKSRIAECALSFVFRHDTDLVSLFAKAGE
ncbi:hypothetical protein BT96DRAFT_458484 [Gymnopus androsaceus JB14]|uniref:Uncharacterized protein n=1 Tax=Gymnopus androsaceus JB14 TaxID=1447944 RepID=A0A6A4ICC0_9AGAR|nr:hypothetical protein BT96DRAFT_458484 [Gymnopus androsaceus JB14]